MKKIAIVLSLMLLAVIVGCGRENKSAAIIPLAVNMWIGTHVDTETRYYLITSDTVKW